MDFSAQDWTPPAGPFRVDFHVEGGLEAAAVDPFLRSLVGYVPVAPVEAELGPEGAGWLRWDADEDLTVRDQEEIIAWLESRPRLVSVRCVAE